MVTVFLPLPPIEVVTVIGSAVTVVPSAVYKRSVQKEPGETLQSVLRW